MVRPILAVILLLAPLCIAQEEEIPQIDQPVDLVVVIDDSSSVTEDGFRLMKQFVAKMTDYMTFGTSSDPGASQLGVTKFGLRGNNEFYLNTHSSQGSVVAAIDEIEYGSDQSTVLANGMLTAIEQFSGDYGSRPDVTNIMLIITDGNDESDVASALEVAKQYNINVFAIGVGEDVELTQLIAATGSSGKVYTVNTWGEMESLMAAVIGNILNVDHCHNGGTLVCFCPPAFTGPRCEELLNPCVYGLLCGPDGTCVFKPQTPEKPFECICPDGQGGDYCRPEGEIMIPCTLTYSGPDPNPSSECPSGTRCIPNVFDCLFDPCTPPDSDGWCVLAPPPFKELAEIHSRIKRGQPSGPCLNGGTGRCECPSTHTGRYCLTPFNWCDCDYTHNPGYCDGMHGPEPCGCSEGHGHCHYDPDPDIGAFCVCDACWTGQYCREPLCPEMERCYLQYGVGDPSRECRHLGTGNYRCIPDNIDCALQYCPHPRNIGYCVPPRPALNFLELIRQIYSPRVIVYDDPEHFADQL